MKTIITLLTVTTAQLHPQFLASLKAPNPWLHSVKIILRWFNSTDIKCLSNTFAFQKLYQETEEMALLTHIRLASLMKSLLHTTHFCSPAHWMRLIDVFLHAFLLWHSVFVPSKMRRQHRRKSAAGDNAVTIFVDRIRNSRFMDSIGRIQWIRFPRISLPRASSP